MVHNSAVSKLRCGCQFPSNSAISCAANFYLYAFIYESYKPSCFIYFSIAAATADSSCVMTILNLIHQGQRTDSGKMLVAIFSFRSVWLVRCDMDAIYWILVLLCINEMPYFQDTLLALHLISVIHWHQSSWSHFIFILLFGLFRTLYLLTSMELASAIAEIRDMLHFICSTSFPNLLFIIYGNWSLLTYCLLNYL